MVEVKIYTLTGCPSCAKAKELLKSKGVKFKEIKVDDDKAWENMVKLTGAETTPQIFINGKLIGGCDNLVSLDKQKKLDLLLK